VWIDAAQQCLQGLQVHSYTAMQQQWLHQGAEGLIACPDSNLLAASLNHTLSPHPSMEQARLLVPHTGCLCNTEQTMPNTTARMEAPPAELTRETRQPASSRNGSANDSPLCNASGCTTERTQQQHDNCMQQVHTATQAYLQQSRGASCVGWGQEQHALPHSHERLSHIKGFTKQHLSDNTQHPGGKPLSR